jgi:hypothetical protein
MKRTHLLALFALALPVAVSAQTSSVPGLISYQGRVADAAGVPIGNTAPVNRTVVFRIWDSPSATAPANRLYSEQQNVTISGGEFSVLVGTGTPVAGETGNAFSAMSAAVFNGQARFLGVTVDDGDGNPANDAEASPRQQVVTTPFAFRAQVAEAVAAGGVASTALANDAVGSAAIAAGAVTGAKLAASAVGTAALADTSVTSGKLAANAVTTTALADGSVTGAKLAAGGIDATKLADGTVILAKLAAASVDSTKLVDGSVATVDLADAAVATAKVADGAITAPKLGTGAVETAKLADGAVSLAKQGANSVDSSKIVDGSIALADLTTTVREGLPKQRHIYNQAVNPAIDPKGRILIPIDLGDLGNDVDGCYLRYYGWHKTSLGTDARTGDIRFNLQQPGFVNDPNFPNIIWVVSLHTSAGGGGTNNVGFGMNKWRLNPQALNNGTGEVHAMDDWCAFYNFYPGSLRPGEAAPFNQNQEPNASNANAGGYPQVLNVVSAVVSGTDRLTITVNNPHAIQVGDTLTIAGMTGTPAANGANLVVTGQPDRYSFEIALNGAAGTYSGGTVTYQPKYNKFRIWAAVNPGISMRFIVSDR